MQNKQIVLTARPVGVPSPAHFALIDSELPELQPGEFLVKNVYLSIDPAQRGYVNDENNYSPPVALGSVMRSMAVGVVVQSRHAQFQSGDALYGWFGWQEFCVCTPAALLRRVDRKQGPLSAGAGIFGINGLTAYLALQDIGKLDAQDTVVVTAAAGAVGSVVGQLARLAGCRTVAVVGSDGKGVRCKELYGYDAYVNHHGDVATSVHAACPNGIDVFFDNVSGEISDIVFGRMNTFGRVIKCGTMAIPVWLPTPQGPRTDREILTRRLRVEGFVIFDHIARFDAAASVLAAHVAQGVLRYDEDIELGLEHAPRALVDVYSGRNSGKKLVQLCEP